MNSAKNNQPFRLAIGQLPITGDARQNSKWVKQTMRKAAAEGARLIQFPEGMLSGYAKNPIMDWSEVNWDAKARELRSIMRLAAQLKIWVVLGSAHPLTPPHWPHNSLYVISDAGELVTRYDKRIVSFTEVTKFYTAGYEPIVFEIDGYRFGCVICVEINFPELFIEYGNLDIDCLMFSAYPVDAIFDVKARAYAAVHNYWVSLATPSETSNFIQSSLIGPDGEYIARAEKAEDMVVADMNPSNPQLDIALNKARPWRKDVWTNPKYQTRGLNDPRSVNRTMI